MKRTLNLRTILTSLLICAIMICGFAGLGAISAFAAEEGSVTVTIDTGDEVTLKDTDGYYQIGTANELYAFAVLVNNDHENYGSANAVLVDDIDLNPGYTFTFIPDTGLVEVKKDNAVVAYLGMGIKGDTSGSDTAFDETASETGKIYVYDAENGSYTESTDALDSLNKWTPIGIGKYLEYAGAFDGQGHTVSGMYINSTESNQGLFGYVSNGSVQNVTVANSYVKGYYNSVGGVAGMNNGTVKNCTNTGSVFGSVFVGGVVGYNFGTVTNCCNSGSVSGESDVGGVVGINYGTVKNCYNTGSVTGNETVGGVVGTSSYDGMSKRSTVENCYNTGSVTGESDVGGVAGRNDSSTVENCYNIGKVIGESNVGGVTGIRNNYSGIIASVTNSYYLDTCGGSDSYGGVSKTSAQFASGEVAYLLNGSTSTAPEGETLAWYQDLNETNGDAAPVLVSTGSNTVYYGYISCADDANMIYTNNSAATETKPEHKDENADHICDNNCGKQDIAMDLHKDANKDHACDYGCDDEIGDHVDANKDHDCDYGCADEIGDHADANSDHACDYGCAVAISEHVYDNACDTDCNICSQTRTPAEHYSENADGKCDVCGESFKLSGGAIAGIVVGGVVVLGLGGFAIFWFVIKKKKWSDLVGIFKK